MERGRSAKCGRARETSIVIGERMKEKRGRNGDRAREVEKEEEREGGREEERERERERESSTLARRWR